MTGTTSNADIAEIGRLFAQFLASMSNATTTIKRNILLIEKLIRQEEFLAWRENLVYTLRRYNLSRYITSNIPKPTDNVKKAQ